MTSVYREKVSEDKQGFIDRSGRGPRRLQLALVSKWRCQVLLPDPATKGYGNREIAPSLVISKNMFSC